MAALKRDVATERFYEAVWPHRAMVLRAALIQTGNSADADDLAQETLLKAFASIDQFKPGTHPKAWLMTILRHAWVDRMRKRSASSIAVNLDDVGPELEAKREGNTADPENIWASVEALLEAFSDQQVIDALQTISEELRWTLLLVDVEQLDHADAANILNIPVGTVKSRVHRARTMLHEVLTPLAVAMRLVTPMNTQRNQE